MQATGPANTPAHLSIPGDIQVNAVLTLAGGAQVFMSALDFGAYRDLQRFALAYRPAQLPRERRSK